MNKKYFEKYARLTLQFCGFNKDNFENIDKPDLQNNIDGIGIEVTEAISSDEGYLRNACNKYFNKGITPKEFKEKGEVKSHKFNGIVYDTEGPITISRPLKTMKSNIDTIINSIEEKINLSKGYKKFKSLGLFIFGYHILPNQENDMKNAIYKINICPFDFIVIMTSFNVFIFKDNNFKSFNINNDEIRMIREKALNYSEKFKN